MRRAARTDANHAQIIGALRDIGCSVLDLSKVGSGCPDILVSGINRRTGFSQMWLMELKTPKGALTEDQKQFQANWRGPVHIVRSVDDAYRLVGIL